MLVFISWSEEYFTFYFVHTVFKFENKEYNNKAPPGVICGKLLFFENGFCMVSDFKKVSFPTMQHSEILMFITKYFHQIVNYRLAGE